MALTRTFNTVAIAMALLPFVAEGYRPITMTKSSVKTRPGKASKTDPRVPVIGPQSFSIRPDRFLDVAASLLDIPKRMTKPSRPKALGKAPTKKVSKWRAVKAPTEKNPSLEVVNKVVEVLVQEALPIKKNPRSFMDELQPFFARPDPLREAASALARPKRVTKTSRPKAVEKEASKKDNQKRTIRPDRFLDVATAGAASLLEIPKKVTKASRMKPIQSPTKKTSRTKASKVSTKKASRTVTVEEVVEAPTKKTYPGIVNEPKPFFIRPDRFLDVATAGAVSMLRLGSGAFVQGYKVEFIDDEVDPNAYTFIGSGGLLPSVAGKKTIETSAQFINRPKVPIKIYEFQGCPFCAKVREAVSILDLDVLFLPCPIGGYRWRAEARALGGKAQFPFMVDENTNVSMYESTDIIQYLADQYGDGSGQPPAFDTLSVGLALAARLGKGSIQTPSKIPDQPITFWAYEASPFSKLVKEVLTELEIPHIQKPCARGSANRIEMIKKVGTFLVPYIEDPNTGVKMFESADIVDYLYKTYKAEGQE